MRRPVESAHCSPYPQVPLLPRQGSNGHLTSVRVISPLTTGLPPPPIAHSAYPAAASSTSTTLPAHTFCPQLSILPLLTPSVRLLFVSPSLPPSRNTARHIAQLPDVLFVNKIWPVFSQDPRSFSTFNRHDSPLPLPRPPPGPGTSSKFQPSHTQYSLLPNPAAITPAARR
ncbi:hypothetical protein HNY73_021767 [Argiope bruennichi]|uniref:Uncharacterized protein n=1 Tax=Argiope bruennichi TaxID=94029 RepID=A0A8T0DZK1_ARGBR|nr:hypothetical protein HNY73_021767 [Argiope bruennichi]